MPQRPIDGARDRLPIALLRSVARSREMRIVDASAERFDEDPWMLRERPGGILCVPLEASSAGGATLTGLLYLEHADTVDAFTGPVVEGIALLAAQAATVIDNARLREALVQARAEFRGLFENAAEGIFRAGLDGSLLLANDALAEALGHAGAESLMAAVGRLRDLAADPEQADGIAADLRTRGALRGREFEALRRDGSRAWLELSARTVRDEDGHPRPSKARSSTSPPAGNTGRQSRRGRRRPGQADFLASMSHEIRTPMNAIVGFADLALSTELSARQREYVGNIHDAADALLGPGLPRSVDRGRTHGLGLQPLDAARLKLSDPRRRPARHAASLSRPTRRRRGPASPVWRSVRSPRCWSTLVDPFEFTPDGEVSIEVVEVSTHRLDFRVRDDQARRNPRMEQERLFDSFQPLDTGTTRSARHYRAAGGTDGVAAGAGERTGSRQHDSASSWICT
ncbi:MAG: histidine kinase dimerization/phospho-acceptor domain-containing protein [Gammaproteobacteria bacterium]|nr:histidine kinase dimerization/phospho-acceptor domain-containing protein [Gammaproteobacteria bacterium]